MNWYDDVIETIDLTEHYKAEVRTDQSPLNPRYDYDNAGRIVYFERGAVQEGRTTEVIPSNWIGDVPLVQLVRWLRIFHGAEVALIRGYVHSGTALTVVPWESRRATLGYPFNDRWDSMWWGLIFVTRDDLKREWMAYGYDEAKARATAQECMKIEVETLQNWINGDVYRYTVVAKEPGSLAQDILDDTWDGSCGGFFGYDHKASGLLEYATDEAEGLESELADQMADDEDEEAAMRQSELGMMVA